jgi:hypothetical protein
MVQETMTQPKFAPIGIDDEVRPSYKLDVPRPWTPHRPGEFDARAPREVSSAGPDQGYLSLLAERFVDNIMLGEDEFIDDVLAGAIAIGMARAGIFGRAPVGKDLEFALGAFGYLQPPSPQLVSARQAFVGGVAHDLWHRRELVALFSKEQLRLTPEAATTQELWRSLAH